MTIYELCSGAVEECVCDCVALSLSDGLRAYTAPVGHVMNLSGSLVYLNDSTYDGSTEGGYGSLRLFVYKHDGES